MATRKSMKGTWSELKAAAEYTKLGFFVSKSLDPLCPFDLVVTDTEGRSFLVDVKTISTRRTGPRKGHMITRSPNTKQKKMGVRIRYVNYEEDEIDAENNNI